MCKMKKLFLTFSYLMLLLAFSNVFAQQQIIRPAKGEIVFVTTNIKSNKELFEKNNKEKQSELVSDILLSMEKEQKIDSAVLKRAKELDSLQLFGLGITEEPATFHHVYQDTLIRSFQSKNGNIIGDYTLINPKNSTFVLQSKLTPLKIYTQPETYTYVKNAAATITEFRNERKKLLGYDCFKVIYNYKFDNEDGGLPPLLANELQTTEFWVTEKIQSLFHPVCREKEILVKYYPLEIIATTSMFKGMITFTTLKSISLSN